MRATCCLGLMTVVVLCLAAAKPAKEEDKEPLLVSVSGVSITQGDLERWLRSQYAPTWRVEDTGLPTEPISLNGVDLERRAAALQVLIDRRLLVQEVRDKRGWDESVERSLEAIGELGVRQLQQRAGSRLKAARWLAQYGMTIEQFRKIQTDEALLRMAQDQVFSTVNVTPRDVRRYYAEHPDEFRAPRAAVYRQIFLPVVNDSDEAVQRARAEAALKEIQSGDDFADVAQRYSSGLEDHPGGLHEVELPEDAPDWLPAAAAGLEPGQVSDIRTTPGGLSIARLDEIRPERQLPFVEVQDLIRPRLLAAVRAEAMDEHVAKLRAKAKIIYSPTAQKLGLLPAGQEVVIQPIEPAEAEKKSP